MIRLTRANGREATANDDRIVNNYAFMGQSGVIERYGNEMGYDASVTNQFTVKTGRAVIQGVDFEISQDEMVQLQSAVSGVTYYYALYAEIDLSAVETETVTDDDGNPVLDANGNVETISRQGAVKLKFNVSPTESPAFPNPNPDNLNEQPNGVARFPLYRFKQTASGIQEIEKQFSLITPENLVVKSITTRCFNASEEGTSSKNTSLVGGYVIPDDSIPTKRVQTIHELTGNLNAWPPIVEYGKLSPGWYEIELGGGGGGGGGSGTKSPGYMGGRGGGLISKFFVPYIVNYKLMPGGGGGGGRQTTYNYGSGGGGGGGSVLDIPQLGILFIASGGGGGAGGKSANENLASDTDIGHGGGGGGYGGGGSGCTGYDTSTGNNGGSGGASGGVSSSSVAELPISSSGGGCGGGGGGSRYYPGLGGGAGGNGGDNYYGDDGGVNVLMDPPIISGGGGGDVNGNGGNGFARLYKLG